MFKKNREYHEGALLLIICLVFTVIHFLLAKFPKAIEIYPDELRYYEIARSFFYGQGISYRGIPFNFQKIAYSFLLAPSFFIKNGLTRISIIGLLNSILLTLSVIPVWYISKKLQLKTAPRLLLLLTLLVWPDMCFSMTIMSENLYWPLFFSFCAIWIKSLESKNIVHSIGAGLLCYLCYLCKESAIALLIAYILLEISNIFSRAISEKSMKFAIDKFALKKVFIFILSFSFLFLFFKLTMFRGMGSSYDQTGIQAILSKYKFTYMLYGFAMFLVALLLASFLFPIAYPILFYKQLDKTARQVLLYTMSFLLVSAAIIAYTITVREDLGATSPRIHLRYVSSSFILLFACFYSLVQKKDIKLTGIVWKLLPFTLIFSFIWKGAGSGSPVDHLSLLWYEFLQAKIGTLTYENRTPINLYAIVINISVCVLWLILHFLFCKNKKIALHVFSFYVLALCLFDSALVQKRIKAAYSLPKETVQKAFKAIDSLQKSDEDVLLLGNFGSKHSKLFETYFDNKKNLYFSMESDISNLTKQTPVEEITLHENIWLRPYPTPPKKITYVIMSSSSITRPANATLIQDLSNDCFFVYKIKNPNMLSFEKNETYSYIFNGQSLENGYDKDCVRYLNPNGYSFGPYIPLDSGVYTAKIYGQRLNDAIIDVYSSCGAIHHEHTIEQNDNSIDICFKLKEHIDDLEILIKNIGSEVIQIKSIAIEKE